MEKISKGNSNSADKNKLSFDTGYTGYIKRNYKDTVFRLLFKDKTNLLSLYNSLNKSNYTDPNVLEVTTIDDSIYLKVKNDLSFIIDDTLYLCEHQSTFNPNMPLRGLFYFAQQYDKIVKKESLRILGSKLEYLPSPKYIVFYNGIVEKEDIVTLRLSDSFLNKEEAAIEVIAKCYNINYGHNKDLLDACRPLMEYSKFVKIVREHIEGKELEDLYDPLDEAILYCIREGILKDFLSQNRTEVIDLFINELYSFDFAVEAETKYLKNQLREAKQREDELRKEKEEAKQREDELRKEKEEAKQREDELKQKMENIEDIKNIKLICENLDKGVAIDLIALILNVEEEYILKIKELYENNMDISAENIFNKL